MQNDETELAKPLDIAINVLLHQLLADKAILSWKNKQLCLQCQHLIN
jgi:hypothetical protein